jgi:hypothetical protein
MLKLVISMEFDRETKNTVRYKSTVEGAPVDTQYIQKSAFNGKAPQKLTITVEAAE